MKIFFNYNARRKRNYKNIKKNNSDILSLLSLLKVVYNKLIIIFLS